MADGLLVVEDDDDLRESLLFLLEHKGFRVKAAANGQEALASIRADDPPCLIILDLMMPVMDGWELRARLLEDPRLAPVPVVLLSGVADLHDAARTLDAVEYLRKPIDISRLYDIVGAHC